MIKALFFDIDGTLVSFKTHAIPSSTVSALEAAKKNGVAIYISTGRPYSLINNIGEIEHLIDGYICTNGAYCFIGDKVISCTPIPHEDVLTVLKEAEVLNFASMVAGEHDIAMFNPNAEARQIFSGILNIKDYGADTPIEKVLTQKILQMTPVISQEQEISILSKLQGVESSRWYPTFADFTARGVSKSKGLEEIASFQGYDIAETMAFGDGGNDMSIICRAGIGVAMGNAGEALKEAADFVTDTVDHNGVAKALKHFGVI